MSIFRSLTGRKERTEPANITGGGKPRLKYYLIGCIPPPLGGVSVYTHRLTKRLEAAGTQVEVVDLSKTGRLGRWMQLLRLVVARCAVIHLNVPMFSVIVALLVSPRKRCLIYHDHGSARDLHTLSPLKRLLFQRYLRRIDECRLVGKHLREYYRQCGMVLPDNTRHEHAFLPPPREEESGIWGTYGESTLQFVNCRRPLIIANAYKIVFHDGIDLYGLDICVRLASRLKAKYPDFGLLFALPEVGDEPYYQEICDKLREHGTIENFHFMTGQRELWPLFRKADLMIRPTTHDGYAVSVVEALYLGCPVVASDVCARPPDTVLFRSRDTDDLYRRVCEVLAETRCHPEIHRGEVA